ncbi:heat shock protein 90 [Candidatus Uzinura diaspidicola str. ASNER]|uniref:Heat shock protein 90 n=1 Tax=Candidatus Uzinura diaspidicola str. ASNER TaxID=1133592 RepID=L7VMR6_9FLAO|nr:heat shock protein 90 [Candidatus Uzinura diaspidicola str. ASNER]
MFFYFYIHYFMAKGTIHVTAENIFPIIKKFLYSDKEIFLREIISNAIDATLKFKKLFQLGEAGEAKEEITETKIEIKINKKEKTLHIIDEGIGMSIKEIDKYINKIAFSGAEEFISKYKDQEIIGHFGLGFYSAFMVSDKVEIFSKSYIKDIPPAYWCSSGTPIFILEEGNKKERGTEIVLHINKDSKEFLDASRIHMLLKKYCKYMPVPIKFGDSEEKETKIKDDNIINDPTPVWTKNPLFLKEKDYKDFYSKIFPTELDGPLFWIHLNIEHPFHLTGILYFPKLKNQIEIHKKKIHLYKNQVFVTDNVEGIVPEFLHLLRGIIDSPDIPLNVSRSNLQADEAVKKISGYIIRKVAEKFSSIINNNRALFEKKWEDIKIIIEHGMLSEEKFFRKANDFFLYSTVDGRYFTFDEFTEKIRVTHKNKENNKLIYLYSSNKETQHSYIKIAKDKSYEVLLLDSPLSPHLIQKLEVNHKDIFFTRVDSDTIENLFKREEITISKLSENEKEILKKILSKTLDTHKFRLFLENLESRSFPFIITNPEFMRRMKDMSKTGVSKNTETLPDVYHLKVNINNEFIRKILKESNPYLQNQMIEKSLYLAMLSKNILAGEALSKFVARSFNELLYHQ